MTQASTLTWTSKPFTQLTTIELFQAYKLRVATFVVSQNRIYQEVDDNDPIAYHVFAYDGSQIVAYARVFKEKDHVTFGRVVTAESHRGIGLGTDLMTQIMATIEAHFNGVPIEIEAQIQVAGYYQKFGFETVGDQFIFNSTPHIKMVHPAL